MTTGFPLISVIVITYNHASFIQQALEGIVKQQGNFELEIILSNDCSTDDTDAAINSFINNYDGTVTLRYFRQSKNLGILPNLIFALKQCEGDFIAICEGDDFWTDHLKLEQQFELLVQKQSASMIISNRSVLDEDGKVWEERYDFFHNKKVFGTDDIIKGFIPGTNTFFFRKVNGLIWFLEKNADLTHADQYISYYYSLIGDIVLLSRNTATYRLTGSGAWSSNSSLQKLQIKARQLEDFHRRLGLPINNYILARNQFNCMWVTLKYCLKRPGQLKIQENKYWIFNTWKRFSGMNRLRILKDVI